MPVSQGKARSQRWRGPVGGALVATALQRSFGRFLDTCACCDSEAEVVRAIQELDSKGIKGLGPAAANILYFLHPTLVPPFNTAMVNGYNALTGAKVKLGRWQEYLAMREGVLRLNQQYRRLLSNDLGAVAGLLFDLGSERYPAPPRSSEANAIEAWEADLAQVRADADKDRKAREAERAADTTHTTVQGWLRDLGIALGFRVFIAAKCARLLPGACRDCVNINAPPGF